MFYPLHRIINQELYEKYLFNQYRCYENYNDSLKTHLYSSGEKSGAQMRTKINSCSSWQKSMIQAEKC